MKSFDLIVIGGGSGGIRAARRAAERGAKTLLIEQKWLGGTCVNVGCVPKKYLMFAADYGRFVADASGYGWQGSKSTFDWSNLIANKDREIARLHEVYRQLLASAGVKVIQQRAEITQPKIVTTADGSCYQSERILLATGGTPNRPQAIAGHELAITSDEVFFLKTMPRSLLIVGSGYTGVELASAFAGFGCQTTLSFRANLPLRGFDSDLRARVLTDLENNGVRIRNQDVPVKLERGKADQIAVTFAQGACENYHAVLLATGRNPVAGQAVSKLIKPPQLGAYGHLIVDSHFRSSEPWLYGVGDNIAFDENGPERLDLTPVAIAEAETLIQNLFSHNDPTTLDYRHIPVAVFCTPQLASVGYHEADARQHFAEIDVFKSQFQTMRSRLAARSEMVTIKMLVDRASEQVVGLHLVAPDAAEMIIGFAVAVRAGLKKSQFDATIGIHPTSAEEIVTL